MIRAIYALLFFSSPAWSLVAGTTSQNRPFVAGGISLEERSEMDAVAKNYNFMLVTAEVKSGYYLADVDVQIRSAEGRRIYGARLPGPILMVHLLPGRYVIDANFRGQTRSQKIRIPNRGHRESVFYF